MKDYKRAYRRYMKNVKLLKRIKDWFPANKPLLFMKRENDLTLFEYKNRPQIIEEVMKGESHTFLRTTGRPCNCSMCTYYKYERTPKQKINKQIWDDIIDSQE